MIRRPPRSTHCISSAASDVYKRQPLSYHANILEIEGRCVIMISRFLRTSMSLYRCFASTPFFDKKTSLHFENLPIEWNEDKVREKLSVVSEVCDVRIIKNKLGHSSGKAIVVYETAEGAKQSYSKFKDANIGLNPLKVRPCFDSAEEEVRRKTRIKLCNVPYTITEDQVNTLLEPFAQIEEIVFLYYP
eukprot:TRINITY_DN7746_c0_g1_i2.p1 TRINITY_DN7746_c0_g1~~TRINITY_DN7746_c0_g1_i2.p1  ORF type:complete len:199 (+),score=59.17 TRINITY_DN7746_c0_g1_i2:33-599(+)